MEVFSRPSFDPEIFTKLKFAEQTEEKCRDFRTRLLREKEKISSELKSCVYDNYPSFIETSKQISSMVGDMQLLSGALSDMKDIIRSLEVHSDSKDDTAWSPTDSQDQQDPSGVPATPLSARAHSRADLTGGQLTADEQELRSIPDELDVSIAQRNFEKSMKLVERAEDLLMSIPDVPQSLQRVLIDRASRLAAGLSAGLRNPNLRKTERQKFVEWLTILGREDEARDIFLQARSDWIRLEIRKLKFQGDIALYVDETSHLVFSAIRSTCVEFRSLFQERAALSEFMLWANKELDTFAATFRSQVFLADSFKVMADCLQIALNHCRSLEDKGISVTFRLQSMFTKDMEEAIRRYVSQLESIVNKAVATDTWNGREMDVLDQSQSGSSEPVRKKVRLTDSGKTFYATVQRLVADVSKVADMQLYSVVVTGLVSFFENYLLKIMEAAQAAELLEDRKNFSLIANAMSVVDDLLPRVITNLKKLFKRNVPELERLRAKLDGFDEHLCELYAAQRAHAIVNDKLGFASSDKYPQVSSADPGKMVPSREFQQLFGWLSKLCANIVQSLPEEFEHLVVSKLLDQITLELLEADFWSLIESGEKQLSTDEANQVGLDLKFFAECCGGLLSDSGREKIDQAVEKVDTAAPGKLKDESWFEDAVDRACSLPNILNASKALMEAERKQRKRSQVRAQEEESFDD